ncbi:MAG: YcjX family protein [Hyphomicrobiaceae bacterium]|nr:YcjX family protein [Hyphomicrobiaceae bacterium]
MKASDVADTAVDVLRNVGAFAHDLVRPTVRLGVTGLSRAGKTVFITSLIHNLLAGGRLPFFDPVAQGRLHRAYLEPQPDDDVPRFDYERHLADLLGSPPKWPESTRRLSQLRLTLEFEPLGFLDRNLGRNKLHVDIVDYPGEWLLDLPLLGQSYEDWSMREIAMAREPNREALSRKMLALLEKLDPSAEAREEDAQHAAAAFTSYLQECRDKGDAAVVPPGRFLMPGEFEGSPALTFAPLLPSDVEPSRNSLWGMMARRYEAYKSHIVKPFFRDHFARLDRQIVLVDALTALNGGRDTLHDLQRALTDILGCFRPGSNSWLSSVLYPRIDKILFAATKADHLHHTSHDRLEAIVRRLAHNAIDRADFAGAEIDVVAVASVRATREGNAKVRGEDLPCIFGYPLKGEKIGTRTFDGNEEYAIFPGDLPHDPDEVEAFLKRKAGDNQVRVVRFRPPDPVTRNPDTPAALPHIRLDRALNFLLGDKMA